MTPDAEVPDRAPRAKLIDRRAGSTHRTKFDDAVEQEAAEERRPDIRADGSVRRLNPGGRSFADFFSEKNRQRPMVRGEVLGFLEMLAYNRKAMVWWRRVARWLTRKPGPGDMWDALAIAHYEKTVRPAFERVQAQLNEAASKANAAATPPRAS
jgi:hypothetical protein